MPDRAGQRQLAPGDVLCDKIEIRAAAVGVVVFDDMAPLVGVAVAVESFGIGKRRRLVRDADDTVGTIDADRLLSGYDVSPAARAAAEGRGGDHSPSAGVGVLGRYQHIALRIEDRKLIESGRQKKSSAPGPTISSCSGSSSRAIFR